MCKSWRKRKGNGEAEMYNHTTNQTNRFTWKALRRAAGSHKSDSQLRCNLHTVSESNCLTAEHSQLSTSPVLVFSMEREWAGNTLGMSRGPVTQKRPSWKPASCAAWTAASQSRWRVPPSQAPSGQGPGHRAGGVICTPYRSPCPA